MTVRRFFVGMLLYVAIGLGLALTLAYAGTETKDAEDAARYEFFMFGEENNLWSYADRTTVGAPWTVSYYRARKDQSTLVWTVTDCDTLTEAVVRIETNFIDHQEESFTDQCRNESKK